MTYITATTVIPEYIIFPQTSTVNRYTETSALISAKIPRAEAEIDSYCARRYAVPFTTVPPRILEIDVKLTAYYTLQSKFTRDSHNTNEWVDKLYDQAIQDLKLIRDREIDLVDTSGTLLVEKTASSRVVSSTQDYQPWADVDTVTSWEVDSDRLNAIDR